MNPAAFEYRLRRLETLRRGLPSQDFFLRHEDHIVDFLISFQDQTSHPTYRLLTQGLYFELWIRRLAQYTQRQWLVTATIEELLNGKQAFERFLGALDQLPILKRIIGDSRLSRHKSDAKLLEARISQRWKATKEAIRLFDEAAEEMEGIVNPTDMDLADAATRRAHGAEMRGFRCLRNRPAPDLEEAYRQFRTAARLAKRSCRLLRQTGASAFVQNGSIQHLCYLRYWQHVAAMGFLPLQSRFSRASRHVDMAFAYVTLLPTFPLQKKYLSPLDIKNQSIVIDAYESLIASRDLPKAQHLLADWLERSNDIEYTGRYARIQVRKYAVDILLAFKHGRSKPRRLAVELERLVESRRIFGNCELYIRQAIRSLLGGNIDSALALNQIASVFVLDASPPSGFEYLDMRTDTEKSFSALPKFFWDWIVEVDSEDVVSEEVLYLFLLYVRTVAEYWCSVYQKRLRESRVSQTLTCPLPESFARTNWDDLLELISQLSEIFDTAPKIAELRDLVRKLISLLSAQHDNATSCDAFRTFVKEAICKTEQQVFPHPVLLCGYQMTEGGKANVTLKQLRRTSSDSFQVIFRPRHNQVLSTGSYYYLKPRYKRSERAVDHEDVVLYPMGPATCFGEPSHKKVAVLVEGSDDYVAFESILNRLNPHWVARIEIIDVGGASHFAHLSSDLLNAQAYDDLIIVGDVIGYDKKLDQRHPRPFIFTLDPDLEGVQPEALRLALQVIAPDLLFTSEEIINTVRQAKLDKQSTVACLKNYQKYRDSAQHAIFDFEESLKRELALLIPRKMIEIGLCEQMLSPVAMALKLGFGHS